MFLADECSALRTSPLSKHEIFPPQDIVRYDLLQFYRTESIHPNSFEAFQFVVYYRLDYVRNRPNYSQWIFTWNERLLLNDYRQIMAACCHHFRLIPILIRHCHFHYSSAGFAPGQVVIPARGTVDTVDWLAWNGGYHFGLGVRLIGVTIYK